MHLLGPPSLHTAIPSRIKHFVISKLLFTSALEIWVIDSLVSCKGILSLYGSEKISMDNSIPVRVSECPGRYKTSLESYITGITITNITNLPPIRLRQRHGNESIFAISFRRRRLEYYANGSRFASLHIGQRIQRCFGRLPSDFNYIYPG